MAEIHFTVYGKPKPGGSKTTGVTKDGRRFVRDSSGEPGKSWRQECSDAALVAVAAWRKMEDWAETKLTDVPFEGPLEVKLAFYVDRPLSHYGKRGLLPSAADYPEKRPDVLKLARAVEDALTGIVWRDDAQIVTELLEKRYGLPERVEVTVVELARLAGRVPDTKEAA